jgi:hypothetical protein
MGLGVIVAHIFVSYATPDRAIADEVSGWLRAAGHEPFLDQDLHNGISPGEDWKQRLYRELRQVDAVIGVVTKSFVASNGALLSWGSRMRGGAGLSRCGLRPVWCTRSCGNCSMWTITPTASKPATE